MTGHDVDDDRPQFLLLPHGDPAAAATADGGAREEPRDPVTVWVTPSLYVGAPPPALAAKSTLVATAPEAVAVVNAGGTAVLPRGSYDEAADVLRTFGLSEDEIRARPYLAGAGRPGE